MRNLFSCKEVLGIRIKLSTGLAANLAILLVAAGGFRNACVDQLVLQAALFIADHSLRVESSRNGPKDKD